jgi:GDPmannose 4,6-dehydratase
MMLQQQQPEDYVIATGQQYSIKEFIDQVAKELQIKIKWMGKNENEVGLFDGRDIIRIHPRYYRPTDVENLCGDPSKAKKKLGWSPDITFEQLVKEMVEQDLKLVEKDKFLKKSGF